MAAGEVLIGTPDESGRPGDEARQAGDDFREFDYPGFQDEGDARRVEADASALYYQDGEEDYPRGRGGPEI